MTAGSCTASGLRLLLLAVMAAAGVDGFVSHGMMAQQCKLRTPATAGRANVQRKGVRIAPMMLGANGGGKPEPTIKQFLTQRSIQGLIGLMHINRDQITADWLCQWGDHPGLERYHGLHGLQRPSTEYIEDLLRSPAETVIVEFKRRGNGGHGGYSGNNPYLQNHVYEHKTDINPRSLGERLLQVREQLASEWIQALPLIEKENEEVWRSFFEKVRSEDGTVDAMANLQHSAMEGFDPTHTTGSQNQGGDYDLLKSLATVQALKKVKKDAGGSEAGEAKAQWIDRMANVWGGEFEEDMQIGASERFIEELLKQTPSISGSTIVDPVGITEEILGARSEIAAEWVVQLKDIEADHADYMRKLLTEQF